MLPSERKLLESMVVDSTLSSEILEKSSWDLLVGGDEKGLKPVVVSENTSTEGVCLNASKQSSLHKT